MPVALPDFALTLLLALVATLVVVAVLLVVVWAISGPLFGFSETWQLVINTGTTIITFLMVFVLQSSQNRDGLAVQLKLDELITKTYTLDQVNEGYDDLLEGKNVRGIVVHEH